MSLVYQRLKGQAEEVPKYKPFKPNPSSKPGAGLVNLLGKVEKIWGPGPKDRIGQKDTPVPGNGKTILGTGVKLNGNVHAQDSVTVFGHLQGDIETEDCVVVGEGAIVKGNIKCRQATVAGLVRGDIEADQAVSLAGTSQMFGNIKAKSLNVESGAYFTGKSLMVL